VFCPVVWRRASGCDCARVLLLKRLHLALVLWTPGYWAC
jgi:hypothetical protein